MNAPVLSALGSGLTAVAILAHLTKTCREHHCDGLFALAFALHAVQNIREHDHLWTVLNAAASAFFAWQWWNGGGGDGTRRRLRSWARRFRGVRRTAPAGAA